MKIFKSIINALYNKLIAADVSIIRKCIKNF